MSEMPSGATCGECGYFSMCQIVLNRHPKVRGCHWTPPRFDPEPKDMYTTQLMEKLK